VITGASSGIGASTARALGGAGFTTVLGARRVDLLKQVAEESGGVALQLDVTDTASVKAFAAEVDRRFGRVDVLVNNAGLALGLTPVESTPDKFWEGMWEANVHGLLRVTRECLPLLRKAPFGHIVNLGSIAGFEVYKGGAGYAATKWAVRAITRTLRLELNGEPIRVSEIAPGMTRTEFSLVRFEGDEKAATEPYKDVKPLDGDDIAACIKFVVTLPPHVNIDEMVIRPLQQAASFMVARDPELARKLGAEPAC
jgi:NADP-dependent 3-hydroxy acid dehydrogenase YdfG